MPASQPTRSANAISRRTDMPAGATLALMHRPLPEMLATRRSPRGQLYGPTLADRFKATAAVLPALPASVLDAGCGAGILTDYLAELGYQAIGADIASATMEQMASPHVTASIDTLPFGDRSFDAVVASEVLEHLPVDVYEGALNEIGRVARACVVVTVPNRESLESASTRCPKCGCVYSLYGHVRRFDESTLALLLPGWRLARLDQAGPYKARHRSLEWIVRRRLLGRWPKAAGLQCPQCRFRQPGVPPLETQALTDGPLKRLAGAPWRDRWWLVAKYERD